MKHVLAMLTFCLVSASANAALLSRLSGQAYYDDVLDITWVADANLADTTTFGVLGINGDGTMNWATADAWIAAMNTANYLGTNDWRLPTVEPLNGSTFDYAESYNGSTDLGYNQSEQGTAYAGSTGSEMAHLFYNTLNNKGYCDPLLSTLANCSGPQSGYGLTNVGPFSNLQPYGYWSGTDYAPPPSGQAWGFGFSLGDQYPNYKTIAYYAWAVRPGDIAVVPMPAAVWLFGSALGVMGWMRRKIIS
jgi:hypothetical protein